MSADKAESIIEKDHEYVAIVTSNGTRLIVHRTSEFGYRLPTFGTECIGTPKYLSALSEHFGITEGLHIIEHIQCLGEQRVSDHDHDGSLVIVEVEDDGYSTVECCEHVEWEQLFGTDSRLCACPYAFGRLRDFLTQSAGLDVDRTLSPWCSLGFYREVYSSVDKSLEGSSFIRTGRLQQFQFSHRSAIYRIPTATGYVFVKYLPEKSLEIPKTRVIAGCLPRASRSPICINTRLNALLTADFGLPLADTCFATNTPVIGHENPLTISRLVLEQWAQTQQESTSYLEEFVANGVPVCDEKWIWGGLERLESFVERNLPSVHGVSGCMEFCRRYMERLFLVWKDIPLPNTLVHGDLNESNVAQPNGPGTSFLFFDWEYACIGHPFLDLLDEEWNPMFRGEGKFLESWADYARISLNEAKKLASWTKPVRHLIAAIMDLDDLSLPAGIRNMWVIEAATDFINEASSLPEGVE